MAIHEKNQEIFGRMWRFLREAKGLSVNDLSDKINISTTSITSIEKGRSKPSLNTLIRFCGTIDISVSDMLALLPAGGKDLSTEDKIRFFDMLIQ